MKTRVVVLSASVRAGHLRAAEAVELALRQIAPDVEVQNRDVLDFTNAVFRRVYGKAYLDLVNNFPHFVGYFYDWLEGDGEVRPRTRDKLRQACAKLNLLSFERFLQDEQWDLVINTHFLPAELISKLRTSGKLNLPQVTVCTDFDTHRLWVNQPTDRYFCATDEGSLHLQHYGVPAADIDVTGIPIHPVFAEPADRAVSGSTGTRRRSSDIAATLWRLRRRPGRSCVSEPVGRGKAGRDRGRVRPQRGIERSVGKNRGVGPPSSKDSRLYERGRSADGFADLVVSKPGGLTTSERLARGLPMVIVNPIPGQESRNSDYLLESGAGVKVNHVCTLTAKVNDLLNNPDRLARLRTAAKAIGHPQAAFEVARRSLAVIGVRTPERAHCEELSAPIKLPSLTGRGWGEGDESPGVEFSISRAP